jgi:hypothetical protein
MATASAYSGKGGSVFIGLGSPVEIPMKSWTVTANDNLVEVTNFSSRNTGDPTQAVASYVSGIRRYDIECTGFPNSNLSPTIVVGEVATFVLGVSGGDTPAVTYPNAIAARVTDLSFNLDVNGALECTITATSLTSADPT